MTSLNIRNKRAYVHISKSHSSRESLEVLKQIDEKIPCIQTDNGSEFNKDFHQYCLKNNIKHFFTYPYSPKQNAFIERFNRTLSEEFIVWHRDLMIKGDMETLKTKLKEYLDYYNNRRPHSSLGFLSPMQYLRANLAD